MGSIVGGVLINAFKPFIQALNSVMGAVINFAQVVSDALGAIFGWEYQVGGGVANDYEAAAGAAEDIEDATGGAADNAKKLNKYIAAWHEVNNMTSDEGSKGGSGGGGGGGGALAGAADGGEWLQKESLWEKYTSDIDSLYELGEYIGKVLTDAMNGIDWDSVYQSARNFGTGLASFLNGLISPELFGSIGTTIAGALNTVLHGLDSFGETFDWINFGESIAAGINNFFSTFDFGLLANTINVWAKGLLDAIITGLDNIDWEMIGTQIGTFLVEIDFTEIAGKIGQAIWKAINAGLDLYKGLFNAAPVETTILSAFATLKFTGLGKLLSGAILSSIKKGLTFAGIGKLIANAFPGSVIITTITTTMAETGASLPAVLLGTIWTPIQTFLTSTLPGLIGSGITALAGVLGTSILGAGALVVAAVTAAIAGIVAVVTNWDEIKVFFAETIPTWWSETVIPFFQGIPESLGAIWESVKTIASEKWGAFLEFMQGIPENVGSIITSIINWFQNLPEQIGYALGYALGTITAWATNIYDYLSKKIPEIVNSVVQWFSELPQNAYNAISTFVSNVVQWGTDTLSAFQNGVSNIVNSVVQWFSELPDRAYDAIIKIKDSITKWGSETIGFFKIEVPKIVDSIVEFFAELPKRLTTVGEDLIKGLWNGINNMVDWLGTNITGFVNGVIDGFKEGFDEHSPSKVAFEIGDFFTLGLANGITDRFGDIYRSINSFTDNMASTRFSMPVLDLDVDTSKYQFQPAKINAAEVTGKVQEAIQYAFTAGGIIDYNRLGEAVYQAQSQAMQENPVQIGDKDIFSATQRQQRREWKRTHKTGWAGI